MIYTIRFIERSYFILKNIGLLYIIGNNFGRCFISRGSHYRISIFTDLGRHKAIRNIDNGFAFFHYALRLSCLTVCKRPYFRQRRFFIDNSVFYVKRSADYWNIARNNDNFTFRVHSSAFHFNCIILY